MAFFNYLLLRLLGHAAQLVTTDFRDLKASRGSF